VTLNINVSPYGGEITACAKYERADVSLPYFYLNRDAVMEPLLCDGKIVEAQIEIVRHPMQDEYLVARVLVPTFYNYMEVRYRLKLTGKTGSWPYVREQITPEFSLLRFETFCYPLFFDTWQDFRKAKFAQCDISVTVPEGFTAISTVSTDGAGILNCTIAPYQQAEFSFGQVYFLPTIAADSRQELEGIMQFAYDYMNAHFGHREFKPLTIATIPAGFGSFAITGSRTIFLEEGAFSKSENLGFAVHEFIHLDWNAKPKDSVQRSRFFDEAFTCYFENRIMRRILQDDSYRRNSAEKAIAAVKDGKYAKVPICKYGEMEYGDLSYTIGALCMEKLCSLLGEELFDAATAEFLRKHQETPADFEDFCGTYVEFCGKENEIRLRKFFGEWLYSCEWMEVE